jgi:hypothetical protein
MLRKITFSLLFLLGVGLAEGRADGMPFLLSRLDVYLYDEKKAPDADYYAGSIDCNYFTSEKALDKARDLAYRVARDKGFYTDGAGRYYIICAMTSNGKCATKVR